jgi:hypothetical protein
VGGLLAMGRLEHGFCRLDALETELVRATINPSLQAETDIL